MAARSLQELQKRYTSASRGGMGRGPMGHGPGGSRRGGPRPKGKPKNSKATILRLISYIAAYRTRLIFVLLFMLISTLTTLAGGYLLRDVINVVSLQATPDKSILLHIFLPEAVAAGSSTPEERIGCLARI